MSRTRGRPATLPPQSLAAGGESTHHTQRIHSTRTCRQATPVDAARPPPSVREDSVATLAVRSAAGRAIRPASLQPPCSLRRDARRSIRRWPSNPSSLRPVSAQTPSRRSLFDPPLAKQQLGLLTVSVATEAGLRLEAGRRLDGGEMKQEFSGHTEREAETRFCSQNETEQEFHPRSKTKRECHPPSGRNEQEFHPPSERRSLRSETKREFRPRSETKFGAGRGKKFCLADQAEERDTEQRSRLSQRVQHHASRVPGAQPSAASQRRSCFSS